MELTKKQLIVKSILGYGVYKTCLDCEGKYVAFSQITEHLCPLCQDDIIEEIEDEG
jgi:hypothetical protein